MHVPHASSIQKYYVYRCVCMCVCGAVDLPSPINGDHF